MTNSVKKMCWDNGFLSSGNREGMNRPAIALFHSVGSLRSLAREVIQNSMDAKDKSLPDSTPVKVEFNLWNLKTNDYTPFREFKDVIKNSIEFWKNDPLKNDDIEEFIKASQECFEADEIPVLLIRDYNTIGLTKATDNNQSISRFDVLANTEGIHVNDTEDSSGSYGLGKNAPFLFSIPNMVFYSTLDKNGWRGFQGVCQFVNSLRKHPFLDKMVPTNPLGKYLMVTDSFVAGEPILPEDHCDLAEAEPFKRDKAGTDVAIIGFDIAQYSSPGQKNWHKLLAFSVIQNFLMAIYWGKLEVTIKAPDEDNIEINAQTLQRLLFEWLDAEWDTDDSHGVPLDVLREIYETVTDGNKIEESIAEEKDLSIWVKQNESYEGKDVFFRNGMFIMSQNEVKGYCIVASVNRIGHLLLAKTLMRAEPPSHDNWNKKYVIGKGKEDKQVRKLAKDYINKIADVIRQLVFKLQNADITQMQLDSGIGNYLPDTSKTGNGKAGTDELKIDVKIAKIEDSDGQVLFRKDSISATNSKGKKSENTGHKDGDVKHKRHVKRKRIKVVTPGGGNDTGVAPGAGKVKIVSLTTLASRILYKGNNVFKLSISSPKDYNKTFARFLASRDDKKEDFVSVESAWFSDGSKAEIKNGKLGPVYLKKGHQDIFVTFTNKEKMTLSPEFTREV